VDEVQPPVRVARERFPVQKCLLAEQPTGAVDARESQDDRVGPSGAEQPLGFENDLA
jgi:hypothetical protein